MNVGTATTDDAPSILALQRLAYETETARYDDNTLPPLLETSADLLARFGDRRFLKAVEADQIIGSVRGFQEGDTCFVERLIVHPDCRRRGIGTALLNEIEAVFSTARRFELFTGTKSQSNIRLYERLGYRAFRHERVNEKVTLVFMEKVVPRLTIRLDRLELIAATREMLEAEKGLTADWGFSCLITGTEKSILFDTGAKTYTNPVGETPISMGDPFVLQHGGRYYLFGTNAFNEGFKCSESTDLVHWTPKGWAYRETEESWAKSHYWAPEVKEYRGKFYMTYHTHADPKKPSGERVVNIDRLQFDDDGKLKIKGPTRSPQPMPSGCQ